MRKIRKQIFKGQGTQIMPLLMTFLSFSFEMLFYCFLFLLFSILRFDSTILVLCKYLGNIYWENLQLEKLGKAHLPRNF